MDLFHQLVNSIQRQIRIIGKDKCEDIVIFIKIMKTAISDAKRNREDKLRKLIERFNAVPVNRLFRPIKFIRLDENFIKEICAFATN